jgi:hypothetical protein
MAVRDLFLNVDGLLQHRVDRIAGLLLRIKLFPDNRHVNLLQRRLLASLQDLLNRCGNRGHESHPSEGNEESDLLFFALRNRWLCSVAGK